MGTHTLSTVSAKFCSCNALRSLSIPIINISKVCMVRWTLRGGMAGSRGADARSLAREDASATGAARDGEGGKGSGRKDGQGDGE